MLLDLTHLHLVKVKNSKSTVVSFTSPFIDPVLPVSYVLIPPLTVLFSVSTTRVIVQLVLKRYNDSVTTEDVTSNWAKQEDVERQIYNKVLVGSCDVHSHNLAGQKHESVRSK